MARTRIVTLLATMALLVGMTLGAVIVSEPAFAGDSAHPSGQDQTVEPGGSGEQGKAPSDPDGMENGGEDKPGGSGGEDKSDQDGNNGCGNDQDFEDDNRGNCGGESATLHLDHQGTTMSCDGEAVLHFVLNQVTDVGDTVTLTAQFETAGSVSVGPSQTNAGTIHFVVQVEGPDTLLTASVSGANGMRSPGGGAARRAQSPSPIHSR